MSTKAFQNYQSFWPYYVSQHLHPRNRILHFIGTTIGLVILAVTLLQKKWCWILGVPVSGYAFASYGHFFVEKNKPATFQYPWWSIRADFQMFFLICTGRMQAEIKRNNLSNG
jgi:hypothetical protein